MNEINETQNDGENILISQSVAILVDGNNIERSIHTEANDTNTCLLYTSPSPRDRG